MKQLMILIAFFSTVFFLNTLHAQSSQSIQFVKTWGQQGGGNGEFKEPLYVATDGSNYMYVSERMDNRIQKFDLEGNYISQFGGYGSGDGQFDSPRDMVVDKSGNIYIADWSNNRIQKLDANGKFLKEWGGEGTGDGQFKSPDGLAIDKFENIYVADNFNYRIQKFDKEGNFLMKFGSQGTGPGEFDALMSVEVAASGEIYVSNKEKIEVFDSKGNYIKKLSGLPAIYYCYLDMSLDDELFITDHGTGKIFAITLSTGSITEGGGIGNGDGKFNGPQGLAIDKSKNLYVADQKNHRIQKFKFDSPSSPNLQGQYYLVDFKKSNLVLVDNTDGRGGPGQKELIQYGRYYSQFDGEDWKFEEASSGYFYIVGRRLGKVIEPENGGASDGTFLVLRDKKTGADKDQQLWSFETETNGYYRLKNKHTQKYLTLKDGSIYKLTPMVIMPKGGDEQLVKLELSK